MNHLPSVPRFPWSLAVRPIPGDGLLFVSESRQIIVRGHVFERLVPQIDGKRTSDELAVSLESDASLPEIYYAISLLARSGCLVDAARPTGLPTENEAYWEHLGVPLEAIARTLDDRTLELVVLDPCNRQILETALASTGIKTADRGNIKLVLCDDLLDERLAQINQDSLRASTPWLIAKQRGAYFAVSSVMRSSQTACWECLASRLRQHRIAEQTKNSHSPAEKPERVPPDLPLFAAQIASNWIAAEAARFLIEESPPAGDSALLSLDLGTWSRSMHVITRRPQCPACGLAEFRQAPHPGPIELVSTPKIRYFDNGYRTTYPNETLTAYERHVSPLTGIVRRLEPVETGNSSPLNVFTAEFNFGPAAGQAPSLVALLYDANHNSCGKGGCAAQARASALCEALERHSGLFQGYEYRRRSRLDDLGASGIHPNSCMLYSDSQYRERERWNRGQSRCNYVPEPFDSSSVIDWTPVWSLSEETYKYLPTAYCYYHVPRTGGATDQCRADSNGNAAGNTIEEAILQGFLELVERDCVAIWWYNRLSRPGVALESFDDPSFENLVSFLQERGREYWVIDITNDLRVPAFAAISRRVGCPQEEILMGFGAHLSPTIAIRRAVTEMCQLVAFRLSGCRPAGRTRFSADPESLRWITSATLETQPYLAADPGLRATTKADLRDDWRHDIRGDCLVCVSLMGQHGLEVLVLDQTRPDVGLPVVKVFVPGLRHFWARFAPGRLFSVPVKLGWQDHEISERELNPISMFL